MIHAILISPHYDAPADDRAYAARAFATAYASQGISTHVICPRTPTPAPSHELAGALTVHRLNLPTHATPNSFAARAAARVAELATASQCDGIECFDAPRCVAAARALRIAGGHHAPILHLLTAPPEADAFSASDLADRTITLGRVSRLNSTDPLPRVPIISGLWIPPQGHDHAVILPSLASPEHTTLLAQAFAQANLSARGWSLRLAGPTGRWLTASETSVPTAPTAPRRLVVVVTDPHTDPIAARLAVASGALILSTTDAPLAGDLPTEHTFTPLTSTPTSLSDALHTIAHASNSTFQAWSAAQHAVLAAPSHPKVLMPLRRAAWSTLSTTANRAALADFWNHLERALSDSHSTPTPPIPEHAA